MPLPIRAGMAVLSILILGHAATAQDITRPPTSMYDTRMNEVRRASVYWDNHRGPTRRVIDQVVLVPDVPTFFRAIASWDDKEWFPILIDDAELSPKFLRAFRPSRVVRYPGKADPIAAKDLWRAASEAVGNGWARDLVGPPESPIEDSGPATSNAEAGAASAVVAKPWPSGEIVPDSHGPTPPGLVLSYPDSPGLAGAVALAAGRFQPLVKWETKARRGEGITEVQARTLCLEIEAAISRVVPRYAAMGDPCDFLTLAGDHPDRYVVVGGGLRAGAASFDDLVGRDAESRRRWAVVGRLGGDPAQSVYRAMGSLFLQPTTAILFDAYDEKDPDFRPYAMRASALKFPPEIRPTVRNGSDADVAHWHKAFDPINRFGLVYVNTSGGPSTFNLAGGGAMAADIPPSVPSVVIMNHSFSAADPASPKTLAGAWLSGGAYLYFGSMNEPYIQSFRTPTLVVSLLSEGVPIGAAVKMGVDESPAFGGPWRLHLLGDPLFRLDLREAKAPRSSPSKPTSTWPVYEAGPMPTGASASDATLLGWAVKATLVGAATAEPAGAAPPDLESTLLTIRREALPANLRPVLDGLRVDALPRSDSRGEAMAAALANIPAPERSPNVVRALDSWRAAMIASAVDRKDFARASRIWNALAPADAPGEFKNDLTFRVGILAQATSQIGPWRDLLKAALKGRESAAEAKFLRDELSRVEKLGTPPEARSVRRG